MHSRLLELLPLLLVGVVLLVYQLTHPGTSILQFLPLEAAVSATPVAIVQPTAQPTRTPARVVAVASATPAAAACSSSQTRFVGGMLELKAALGTGMGEPLECEHVVSDRGDTNQKTTTGLAYYQHDLNVACFTTGWDHWAMTPRGLVHWTGDEVDPPPDAPIESP